MALVKNLTEMPLEKSSLHQEVDATFSIVEEDGEAFLQIDTYGSAMAQYLTGGFIVSSSCF